MRLLGHTFQPMDKSDWDAFAGADEGSLICHAEDVTLIYSPVTGDVSVIDEEGHQTDWSPKEVN